MVTYLCVVLQGEHKNENRKHASSISTSTLTWTAGL
jgi:hypothetical protein